MSQMIPQATNTPFGGYPTASMLPLIPASDRPQRKDEPLTSAPLDVESALRGEPLRILFIAAEGVPYLKTGGLADIIGALPHALRRLGHDVRLVLPRYMVVYPERWHLH